MWLVLCGSREKKMSGFPFWDGVYVEWCSGCSFGKRHHYHVFIGYLGLCFLGFVLSAPLSARDGLLLLISCSCWSRIFACFFFMFHIFQLHTPHTFITLFFAALLHASYISHLARTCTQLHIWGSCSRSWFFLHTTHNLHPQKAYLWWWLLNG